MGEYAEQQMEKDLKEFTDQLDREERQVYRKKYRSKVLCGVAGCGRWLSPAGVADHMRAVHPELIPD